MHVRSVAATARWLMQMGTTTRTVTVTTTTTTAAVVGPVCAPLLSTTAQVGSSLFCRQTFFASFLRLRRRPCVLLLGPFRCRFRCLIAPFAFFGSVNVGRMTMFFLVDTQLLPILMTI